MSLIRPVLTTPPAFDATQVYVISFTVGTGGSQVTKNQLTIRNNLTNVIVYQQTQTTFQYTHTIPANTLTNGTNYNATVSTFDAAGEQSAESIPVQFWCYTTPVIAFTNIPTGNIIPNASFNFQFSYIQAEGEAINTYEMNLYNSTGSLISSSGLQYTTGMTPPYGYLFAGFEDNSLYYIELLVTTVNNTIVSTGQIQITVKYSQPSIFTLLELTNNCDGGYITVQSNVTLISGSSYPSPPTYIGEDEVDLTYDYPGELTPLEEPWVGWLQGYSISGNYLVRAWFRNPCKGQVQNQINPLFSFSTVSGQAIYIYYRTGYENTTDTTMKSYMEAYVQSLDGSTYLSPLAYYIYSNYIDTLSSTEPYCMWFTCVDNIYQLQLQPV